MSVWCKRAEGGCWQSCLSLQADSCQEDKQHQLAVCGSRKDAVQHLRDREALPGGGGVYPFFFTSYTSWLSSPHLLITIPVETQMFHIRFIFKIDGTNYSQSFVSVGRREERGWWKIAQRKEKAEIQSNLISLNWVNFQTRRKIHVKKWLWRAIEKDPPPASTITSL